MKLQYINYKFISSLAIVVVIFELFFKICCGVLIYTFFGFSKRFERIIRIHMKNIKNAVNLFLYA